jgi:lipoate-protein ligase A
VILWLDGRHDPGENMRRDRALLAAAEAGAPPVLRLFGFAPPGITLGLNQVPERELDLARCTRDGIPWSVRPTGGRAIFHAEEWTYALAAPIDDPVWGGSRGQTYARIAQLLVASLVRLGVPAELVAGTTGTALPRSSAGVAPPCFASSVRHEVALHGRKLVGSAQRRTARALLQQGSLLLGDGHLRLADYLAVPDERREAVREALRMTSTSAGAAFGPDVPLERWADALAAELGPGIRRLEGAAGAFLLTLSKPDSYTSAAFEACS